MHGSNVMREFAQVCATTHREAGHEPESFWTCNSSNTADRGLSYARRKQGNRQAIETSWRTSPLMVTV